MIPRRPQEWDQIAREFQARQQDWPGGPLRDPVEADAPPADLPPGPRVPIDEFRDAEGCLRFPEDWRRGDPEPDLTMEAEDAMIRMCEEFKTKGNDAYR